MQTSQMSELILKRAAESQRFAMSHPLPPLRGSVLSVMNPCHLVIAGATLIVGINGARGTKHDHS